jgi:DNA polymerase-3 subunit delta'
MDILTAAALPWLEGARSQLEQAWKAGRLPHSLLIVSPLGLGAQALAHWSAALVLCDEAHAPCGHCASCRLLLADTHPDLKRVALEEDAQQLKVDQIRALIDSLSLSSYRSGFKVGIVESAEALNMNGANAFLKTLEEPTQSTLLMLVATPAHRLPATIVSRCQRLTLRAPELASARAWLAAQRPAVKRWDAALALAGGAPLAALELEAAGIEALDRDMRESLKGLVSGALDVTTLADRWARSDPVLRLTWLENWITTRVRTRLGGDDSAQTAEPVRLPAALLKPKIRRLFELLDAARELRRLASTGLNQQLALEALLLEGRAALVR